jgi:hypothetical protein
MKIPARVKINPARIKRQSILDSPKRIFKRTTVKAPMNIPKHPAKSS